MGLLSFFFFFFFEAIRFAAWHVTNGHLWSKCLWSIIDNNAIKIVWNQRLTSLTDEGEVWEADILPQWEKVYTFYASTALGSSLPFWNRSHSCVAIPGLLILTNLLPFIILQFSYPCIFSSRVAKFVSSSILFIKVSFQQLWFMVQKSDSYHHIITWPGSCCH